MSFLLPVERLVETDTLLAFHHPRPAHRVHILLVPKQAVASLLDLSPHSEYMTDLIQAVQVLVRQFDLEKCGYRLIANGGPYQEFPHLHFHLVSGAEIKAG